MKFTMKIKDDRLEKVSELRRQVEEIILEKASMLPENLEDLSPEEIKPCSVLITGKPAPTLVSYKNFTPFFKAVRCNKA